MQDSIFTKIITGEIPCHKIYEDERTFVFLDIHPLQPGHTLVVPKNPVEFVWDLPQEDFVALNLTAQKVALRLREVTGKPYVNEMVVGVDVPHAHIHLIPFTVSSELRAEQDQSKEPNHDELAEIAAKLAF